jgi:transposase, IS30 family
MDQMSNYHHLSPEERAYIMLERDRGSSLRQIALTLERSPSTLSRELNRNSPSVRYCASHAGAAYNRRRQRSVRPRKLVSQGALCDKVSSWLMHRQWSPEQIAATLKLRYPEQPAMQISPETIYAHIYAYPRGELRKLLVQSLRRSKSKRGPRGSKASCYSSLKMAPEQMIGNRPADVDSREVAGHWEGDLIVGAMNQSCVGTLVERKTGFVIVAKLRSKSAQHVREGFEANMANVPDFLRLSMTYDRGAEMAEHPLMSKHLDLKIYFADRNAPWQRGSSENINGLLRQFLPRGEDLSVHSQPALNHIAWLLNTRPRKRFEFKTPQELMERELNGGIIRVALDS